MKIAYFVKRPRIKEDLMRPHLAEQERPYEIAKTIMLSAIDYENFTTDMLADRDFLEENQRFCGQGKEQRCLLIHMRGQSGGILVIPNGRYVDMAAIYCLDEMCWSTNKKLQTSVGIQPGKGS